MGMHSLVQVLDHKCNYKLGRVEPIKVQLQRIGWLAWSVGVLPKQVWVSCRLGTRKLAPEMMPFPLMRLKSRVTMSASGCFNTCYAQISLIPALLDRLFCFAGRNDARSPRS